MNAPRRRFLSWRAITAGATVAQLAFILFGSPVELDPRFLRFSRPGLEGLARYGPSHAATARRTRT